MDKYHVHLLSRAVQDLEEIYAYIAATLLEPDAASQLVDAIEEAILSLEQCPSRCPLRTHGIYAGRGYRQLIVKNHIIVFRIDEERRQVIVVTVRYCKMRF